MAVASRITIEEFELLPEALAHNHALVDGELVEVSGNTIRHNYLRELCVELLAPYVRQRGLGRIITEQEYDFDGNAHGPDVSFISTAKLPLREWKRRVQRFVPDLAIEIVSENDNFTKLMEKAARYCACGTTEIWVFEQSTRQAFVLGEGRRELLGDQDLFRIEAYRGLLDSPRRAFRSSRGVAIRTPAVPTSRRALS
jgi:Uma2 family endonuclease